VMLSAASRRNWPLASGLAEKSDQVSNLLATMSVIGEKVNTVATLRSNHRYLVLIEGESPK
jgi:hypothetical protein